MNYLFYQLLGIGQITDTEKVVFYWTTFFGTDHYGAGLGTTPFEGCPVSACRTTRDRRLLNRSDAVIFHIIDMELTDMPTIRRADQRWIFYSMEAPNFTPNILKGLANVFNWTMTYRTDSDVYLGYDMVQSEETFVKFPQLRLMGSKANITKTANRTVERWRPLVRGKTKKVAWFVSHCWTAGKREKYVDQLKKYIDVDVYGWCGDLKCPHGTDCCNLKFIITTLKGNIKSL